MKSLTKSIAKSFTIRRYHNNVRHLSNRCLEDIGLDPHLVAQGPKAYPWKAGNKY